MPFEITTVPPGLPPVTPGVMPQFIQFRLNGVDLGGPDVSVVDLVGAGFVVTRTGDRVTVSVG